MVAPSGGIGPESQKKPKGRPSVYNAEVYPRASREMAAEGKTLAEIAKAFGVHPFTLYTWRQENPDLDAAIKQGNRLADDRVEEALYARAVGYEHPDVHVSNFQGAITLTPIVKRYAPDATSMIFWLKNRRPREWRDRIEISAEVELKMGDAEQALAFAQSFRATASIMQRVAQSIEMRTLPAAEAQGTATIAPVVAPNPEAPQAGS